MPADPAARKGSPTVAQIGKALGTVSDEQLARTQHVTVSPNRNPDDSTWEAEYGRPGFRSAATAGDNNITFYPIEPSRDDAAIEQEVSHETGHLYSQALWKDPATKARWEAAMVADRWSASQYADASIEEDFAESCTMYSLSKGTPCEATARRIFPSRYAELDCLFPHGFPKKGGHP